MLKRKVKPLVFLLLLISLSLVSVDLLIGPVKCQGSWANNYYAYRKSHEVFNTTGAGSNYQIKIFIINGSGSDDGNTVYLNDRCQNDFDDIIFYEDDHTTKLDYWIEEVNDGVNCTVWVEIKDDLSSTNRTVYLYYGNSTISNESNGANTFLLFDHFNDASFNTTMWTESGNGFINETGTTLNITGWDGVSAKVAHTVQSSNTYGATCRFRSRFYFNQVLAGVYDHAGLRNLDIDFSMFSSYTGTPYAWTRQNSGTTEIGYPSTSYVSWFTGEISIVSGDKSIFDFNNGEETITLDTDNRQPNSAMPVFLQADKDYNNAEIFLDWVFIAKYCLGGVNQGSWGTEENRPAYPQYSNLSESTHQANTSCVFSSNWTSETPTVPTYWVFGTNNSGSWVNETNLFPPILAVNLNISENNRHAIDLSGVHPNNTYVSAGSQSFNVSGPESTYNVTALRVIIYTFTGAPDCTFRAGIYNISTNTIHGVNATPNDSERYGYSTNNVTWNYPVGFEAWVMFYFSGIVLNTGSAYCFTVEIPEAVLIDTSNEPNLITTDHPLGDEYDPDFYDGNCAKYYNLQWNNRTYAVYFELAGRFGNSPYWANSTKTLVAEVNANVTYQFWAWNNDEIFNTTGLLWFLTVGVNVTFYLNQTDNMLLVNLIETPNATTRGYVWGSTLDLKTVVNVTYSFYNYTWGFGNASLNPYNLTIGTADFALWAILGPPAITTVYTTPYHLIVAGLIIVGSIGIVWFGTRKKAK